MKKLLIFTIVLFCYAYTNGQTDPKNPVNGKILVETNNVTFTNLWGTSHKHLYALEYLLADVVFESESEGISYRGPANSQRDRSFILECQIFNISSDTILS